MRKPGYLLVMFCSLALTLVVARAEVAQAAVAEIRLRVGGTTGLVHGVDATFTLPAGVTVTASADGSLSAPVLTLTDNGAGGMIAGTYDPSTSTVKVGFINGSGVASGDFAALTVNVTAGVVPADGQFPAVGYAYQSSGDAISGAVVSVSVVQRSVSLSFSGSGSGTVTSDPPGLAANIATSVQFPYGTELTLHATPAEYSIVTGWSGGVCSGTGDCSFTLINSAAVTVTIDRDIAHMVLIDGQPLRYFPTLADAFTNASGSGTIIKAWGIPFAEQLVLTGGKSVTLKGGYNGAYTASSGYTTLSDSLTIADCSLTVENIIIM